MKEETEPKYSISKLNLALWGMAQLENYSLDKTFMVLEFVLIIRWFQLLFANNMLVNANFSKNIKHDVLAALTLMAPSLRKNIGFQLPTYNRG